MTPTNKKDPVPLLAKKLKELELARFKLERQRDEEYTEKLNDAKTVIRNEMETKFGADLKAAEESEYAARDEYLAACEERGKAGAGAPWPLGTKLCHWESPGTYGLGKLRITETGVLEVVTRDFDYPVNSITRVEVGSYVIRLIKKDGTPSKRFDTPNWFGTFHGWYPEGVKPKERGSV